MRTKRLPKAYEMVKNSIEINPNYYKALFNMGLYIKRQ